jgi:hypothetical protein
MNEGKFMSDYIRINSLLAILDRELAWSIYNIFERNFGKIIAMKKIKKDLDWDSIS